MCASPFESDAELPAQPEALPSDDWAALPGEEKEPWTPVETGPPQGPPEQSPAEEEQDPA